MERQFGGEEADGPEASKATQRSLGVTQEATVPSPQTRDMFRTVFEAKPGGCIQIGGEVDELDQGWETFSVKE